MREERVEGGREGGREGRGGGEVVGKNSTHTKTPWEGEGRQEERDREFFRFLFPQSHTIMFTMSHCLPRQCGR